MTALKIKDWREVVSEDWPRQEITSSTVKRAREYQGQVRRPYKSQKYEAYRTQVLNTPLP